MFLVPKDFLPTKHPGADQISFVLNMSVDKEKKDKSFP